MGKGIFFKPAGSISAISPSPNCKVLAAHKGYKCRRFGSSDFVSVLGMEQGSLPVIG